MVANAVINYTISVYDWRGFS